MSDYDALDYLDEPDPPESDEIPFLGEIPETDPDDIPDANIRETRPMTEPQVKPAGMKRSMKIMIIVLIVVVFICALLFSGATNPKDKTPLNAAALDAMEQDLASWGQGRWTNWDASYDYDDGMVILEIAADPIANETALDGYCDTLHDIAKKHAPKHSFVGRIYVLGKVKQRCY